MQNCPRQLAMQSCVLCSFVRCGTSKQIERKKKDLIYGSKRCVVTQTFYLYADFVFLLQLKGTYGDPVAQHTFVAAGGMDKEGKIFLDYIPSFSKRHYQYHVVLTMVGSGTTKERLRYKHVTVKECSE